MNDIEFYNSRCFLGKTQTQLAQLLAVSDKTVQSYEQGWRRIPPYIERQILLLLSLKKSSDQDMKPCWDLKNCPEEWRNNCIIWELKAGNYCWSMTGTFCQGQMERNWDNKIKVCRECEVYKSQLPKI